MTVPNETYEPDPNRVIWTDDADALWEAARQDLPLPGTEPTAAPTSTAPTSTAPPTLTASPADVSVRVVNSSGVSGLARQAGDALAVQGFEISGLANGTEDVDGVVIRHALDDEEAAATLQAAFPGATLREDTTLSAGSYVVDLGRGAPAVVEVPNRTGSEPLPEQPLSGEAGRVRLRLDPDLRRPRRRRRHLRLTSVPAHEEGPRTSVRGPCSFSLCGGGGI